MITLLPQTPTPNIVNFTATSMHYLNHQQPAENESRSSVVLSGRSLGMSPASRYNYNLKVLRRRDPSIISIFDQFSHVCVYHHNGNKWEKQGYEGSMFLYERDSYPPYGFYILNRMGKDDYIQRLYPEDDVGAHESYLMMRYYPEFTANRLAAAKRSSGDIPHKFSNIYAIPNLEKLRDGDKGFSQTVGLWMFATDAREPMIDVMLRLHSYIKKNLPYPNEYRFGPDHPPPPNPHPRTSSPSQASANLLSLSDCEPASPSNPSSSASYRADSQRNFTANQPMHGPSELDLLFAKADPVSTNTRSTPGHVTSGFGSSQSTSKPTVGNLFSTLSGPESQMDEEQVEREPSPPNHGLALLDSIFASATPTPRVSRRNGTRGICDDNVYPLPVSPSHNKTPNSETPSTRVIHAPQKSTQSLPRPVSYAISHSLDPPGTAPTHPTFSAPQILTQDVISGLLGLEPNATSTRVQSHSRSSSSSSHVSQYSGDVEDEDEVVNDQSTQNPHREIRESILSAINSTGERRKPMKRNEFVREILTLIHTDKDFVDHMWQDYMAHF